MKYIKVPYIKLKGKKYMGKIDSEKIKSFEQSLFNKTEGISDDYNGQTTQSLYKMYKAGDVPVEDSAIGSHIMSSPGNLSKVHKILSTIAKKENLPFEQHEEHLSGVNPELYEELSTSPNSYWNDNDVSSSSLLMVDKDGNITFEWLPFTMNENSFKSDGEGNILIPKEDYEEDIEIS